MLREFIERIVEEQQHKSTIKIGQLYYPVDIFLANGNILLRSFRIINIEGEKIKGITWKEQYSAPRESREPVYSYFECNEIDRLSCFDLEIDYKKKEVSRL
jgi:hypothetical protein